MARAGDTGPSPLRPQRYDLYELAAPAPEADMPQQARACRVLPFAAIAPGTQVPPSWHPVTSRTGYRADRVNLLILLD
jgi:hypothetical protein